MSFVFLILFTINSYAQDSAVEVSDRPEEHIVYGVQPRLFMGNPDEKRIKDYYISIGNKDGLKVGSTIRVLRKTPSYDLLSKKLQQDMIFPIARLKVIHAESHAAIARIDQYYSEDTTPIAFPQAIIVGDLVEIAKQ